MTRRIACLILAALLATEARPDQPADGTSNRPLQLRYLYVPHEQFAAVLKAHPGGRFVARKELLKALHGLQQRLRAPFDLSASIVLDAEYHGSIVGNDVLVLSGDLELAKLSAGWSLIRLPLQGVALSRAELDGQPWPMYLDGDNAVLPLKEIGTHRLRLEGSVRFEQQEGNPVARFRLPTGAATKLALADLGQRRILLNGALIEPSPQQPLLVLSLQPAVPAVLTLLPSEHESRRQAVLVARHRVDYLARPDGFDFQLRTDLTVYGAGIRTVTYSIPAEAEIAAVDAPQLERWTLAGASEPRRKQLTLSFREPLRGRFTLSLRGLIRLPLLEPSVVLPHFRLVGAAAETGVLVLRSAAGLRVDVVSAEHARTLSAQERKELGLSDEPDTLAYAFWQEQPSLRLHARVVTAELFAGIAALLEIVPRHATLRTSLTVVPRGAPLRQLTLRLPTGWQIDSVQLVDRPGRLSWTVHRGNEGEPTQQVTATLPDDVSPGEAVLLSVIARRPLESAQRTASFQLPAIQLDPGVVAFEGTLTVLAHPDLSVHVVDVSGLEPVPVRSVHQTIEHQNLLQPIQSFRYRGGYAGRVELTRRSSRVAAEIDVVLRPEPDYISVDGVLVVTNRQAPLDRLTLLVPTGLRPQFYMEPLTPTHRIAEQRWTEAENGYPQLTLTFESPLRGTARFLFRAAVRPKRADNGRRLATVPLLSVPSAERQRLLVAVAGHPELSVSASADGLVPAPLAGVTLPAELQGKDHLIAAFRGSGSGKSVQLRLTSHRSVPLAGAVCRKLSVRTAIAADGSAQHHAVLRVIAPGRQFLTVTLPDETRLIAVQVNGQAVVVRRLSSAGLAVPLEGSRPENRCAVELFYKTPPRKTRLGLVADIDLAAPELDIPVERVTWQVAYAPEYEPVAATGDLRLRTPLPAPSLLDRLVTGHQDWLPALVVLYGIALVAGPLAAGLRQMVRGKQPAAVVGLLAVVAITLVLVFAICLLPATVAVKRVGSRSCRPMLRQLAAALQAYHDQYGRYPPAAIGPHNVPLNRQFSWVVALLPFLEREELYEKLRLDLPVDHPINELALRDRALSVLICPEDPVTTATSFLAVLGSGLSDSPSASGVFGWQQSLSKSEITDPLGTTALLIEARGSGPWYVATEAAILLPASPEALGLQSAHHRVLFADGQIRQLAPSDDTFWQRLATARRGDGPSLEELREHLLDTDALLSDQRTRAAVALEAQAEPASVAAAEAPETAAGAEQVSQQGPRQPAELYEQRQQQAAVQRPPSVSPQAGRRHAHAQRGGARLSLRPTVRWPDWPSVVFGGVAQPQKITLALRNRHMSMLLIACLTVAISLLGWLWPHRALGRMLLAGAVLLAAGAAMSELLPATLTPLSDGLALGGVALLVSCLARRLVIALRGLARHGATGTSAGAAAVIAVASALLLRPNVCAGEEGKEPATTASLQDRALVVYVPYDPANGLPSTKPEVVYVPEAALRLLGLTADSDLPPPPVPLATVTAMDVSATVAGTRAEVMLDVTVVSLVDRPALAILPVGTLPLEQARGDDDRPARLVRITAEDDARDGGERTALVVTERGTHRFRLRAVLPVQGDETAGELLIPVASVPAGTLTLTLPGAGREVTVHGLKGGFRAEPSDGQTRVTAALGRADSVRVRWRPRLRTTARVAVALRRHLLVDIHDSGAHLYERLEYEVHNGTTDQVRLQVPTGLVVLEVAGQDVAGWRLSGDDRTLQVRLKRPVADRTAIELHALDPTAPARGRFMLTLLQDPQAQRQDGTILIGCADQFRVDVIEHRGLTQIAREAAVVPGPGPHPGCAALGAYHFAGSDWSLMLSIERYRSERTVRAETEVVVSRYRIDLTAYYELHVERAPVEQLRVRLPRGMAVLSVDIDQDGARWSFDSATRILRLRFAQPLVGRILWSLRGTMAVPSNAQAVQLVLPEVEAEHRSGTVLIRHTRDCRLQVQLPESMVPLSGDGPARTLARRKSLVPGAIVVLAARYRGVPDPIELTVLDARPRVTARAVTVADIAERWLEFASAIELSITTGTVWQLQFEVPAALGEDIDIQGPEIAEAVIARRSESSTTWSVRLRRGITGRYRFTVWQRLELPARQQRQPTPVPWIRLLGTDSVKHTVVVLPGRNLRLNLVRTRGVQRTQATGLEGLVSADVLRRAAWLFRVVAPRYELLVAREVLTPAAVPDIEVFLLHLLTQLDVSGTYRTEMRLLARNEARQHLWIQLPIGTRLWGAYVDGRPVPVVRPADGTGLLVPLPRAGLQQSLQYVQVVYEGRLSERLGFGAQIALPPPQLADDVPIRRTLWTVFLPDGYMARPSRAASNMEPADEYQAELSTALARLEALRRALLVARQSGAVSRQTVLRWQRELSELRDWQQATLVRLAPSKLARDHPMLFRMVQEYQMGTVRVEKLLEEVGKGATSATRAGSARADRYFSHMRPSRTAMRGAEHGTQPRVGIPEDEVGKLQRKAAAALDSLARQKWEPAAKQARPGTQQRGRAAEEHLAEQLAQRAAPAEQRTARLGIGPPLATLPQRLRFSKESGGPKLTLVVVDRRLVSRWAWSVTRAVVTALLAVLVGIIVRRWTRSSSKEPWLGGAVLACAACTMLIGDLAPPLALVLLVCGAVLLAAMTYLTAVRPRPSSTR